MNNVFNIEHKANLIQNLNKGELIVSAFLNENNEVQVVSKYSDNIWDFSHKVKENKNSKRKIFFNKYIFDNQETLVSNKVLLTLVKDCAFKMVSEGLKVSTISSNVRYLFRFLNYMYCTLKINTPDKMNESEIQQYIQHVVLNYNCKSKDSVVSNVSPIKMCLFKYRKEIKHGINFEPFSDISISTHLDKNKKLKNKKQTEIIPDNLWQQISVLCEAKIDHYIENIDNEEKLHEAFFNRLNTYNLENCNFKRRFYVNRDFTNKENYIPLTYKQLYKTQIAASMIIQAYTGMRASELESLKFDCISKETLTFGSEIHVLTKIKGLTFKYQNNTDLTKSDGKNVSWLCPPIVEKAVMVLTHIGKKTSNLYSFYLDNNINHEYHEGYSKYKEHLILKPAMNYINKIEKTSVVRQYKSFLIEEGLNIDFELTSHCFRRTIARFFARTIIEAPIEALKEQFKHYSADITEYYMKEDKTADSTFMELMEGYSNAKNNNDFEKQDILFEEMKSTFEHSITTANNIEELLAIADGKEVKVINEYLVQLDNNEPLNPLESLTCNGIIILPDIHIQYWKEMLTLYEELVDLEPNSIWYKQEKLMIEHVVSKLENNEAYIAGEK